jgi:hypothetical protein
MELTMDAKQLLSIAVGVLKPILKDVEPIVATEFHDLLIKEFPVLFPAGSVPASAQTPLQQFSDAELTTALTVIQSLLTKTQS